MHFKELDNFRLADTVKFHDHLNPALYHGDHIKPDVREQLLIIAQDFIEHLGVNDLDLVDITISGSNAAYNYTPHSDIDLHILVDIQQFENDDVYRELFDAKKTVYNENHDILINGYEVELYVQDSNEPVISLGEYSILNDKWIKLPRKRKADFDQVATKLKYRKLYKLAHYALKTNDSDKIQKLIRTLKKYRRAGLDAYGEFGPENLAFKALRSKGVIKELYEKLKQLHDEQLSLPENNINEAVDIKTLDTNFKHQMKFGRYIYIATGTKGANTYRSKGYDSGEDIPGLSIEVFDPYNRSKNPIAHARFIAHRDKSGEYWLESDMTNVEPDYRGQNIAYQIYAYAKMLGNDIKKSTDTDGELNQTKLGKKMWRGWGKDNINLYPDSWGKLIKEIDTNDEHLNKPTLNLDKLAQYHRVSKNYLMDQLMKGISIETEHTSDYNIAMEIALDHLKENPNYYVLLNKAGLEECSGYIPSNKEKNDSRWKTALTVDITPNSIKDNAKRLGSKVSRAGIPPLLRP
jgi:hypothetical protein